MGRSLKVWTWTTPAYEEDAYCEECDSSIPTAGSEFFLLDSIPWELCNLSTWSGDKDIPWSLCSSSSSILER
eukprot:8558798-Karenia_brevis.AAC.1